MSPPVAYITTCRRRTRATTVRVTQPSWTLVVGQRTSSTSRPSCRFSMMGSQLVEVLKFSQWPKISCPPRLPRSVLSEPQMAEQLVEVPTDVSFFSQFVEQIRGSSGYRYLQGFVAQDKVRLQRTVQQIVDIPVPGGAQDFSPRTGFQRCFAVMQDLVEVFKFLSQHMVQRRAGSLGTTFMSPLHHAIICSPSELFCRRVFFSLR